MKKLILEFLKKICNDDVSFLMKHKKEIII